MTGRCSCGKPLDDCEQRMLALVQERDTWKRRCVEDTARLRGVVRHERDNLRGAVATLTSVRVWAEIVRDRNSDEHVRRHMRMLLALLDGDDPDVFEGQ